MTRANRTLLLTVAERLFAERGVDAVSLRAVMAEAGTNVAAIHYHFGSKEALIQALVEWRSAEVAQRRDPYLLALEEQAKPTAAGLAEAIVRPVADTVADGGEGWVRVVYRIASTRHPSLAVLDETFAPAADRLGALLRRIDPALSQATVRFRVAETLVTTFRVLGDLEATGRTLSPRGGRVDDDLVIAELIALVTAVLDAPAPGGRTN